MNPTQTNSLILAYLGDAVYELEVRRFLVDKGLAKVKELHTGAVNMVKATTQAQVMHHLLPLLNEEEAAVVRRGRNAKSGTVPKNTELIDYRYATALEALIGYWYLKNEQAKIDQTFQLVLKVTGMD